MKVGIVIEPYEEENTSGIGYVVLKQAEGLLRLDKENQYVLFSSQPMKRERLLRNFLNVIVPKSFLGKFIWFSLTSYFRKERFVDALLFHMPLLPLVVSRSVRTIPVYHEPLWHNGLEKNSLKHICVVFLQKLFEHKALQRAFCIIAPSKATQQYIIDNLRINSNKVKVIYNGFQVFNTFHHSRSEIKYRDHFLFVGRVKYKKNVHNILEGFILFRKKNPHATNKLVIVGLYGGIYYTQLYKRIAEENLHNEIVFTGFVPDRELYNLYSHSVGLIFCSLAEGFGIPIIEAMNLGVPVITSRRAPMDEIAGGAALMVNPEKPIEIMDAMNAIVFNRKEKEKLVERGLKRAKDFSWDKHMQALLSIIKSIH